MQILLLARVTGHFLLLMRILPVLGRTFCLFIPPNSCTLPSAPFLLPPCPSCPFPCRVPQLGCPAASSFTILPAFDRVEKNKQSSTAVVAEGVP